MAHFFSSDLVQPMTAHDRVFEVVTNLSRNMAVEFVNSIGSNMFTATNLSANDDYLVIAIFLCSLSGCLDWDVLHTQPLDKPPLLLLLLFLPIRVYWPLYFMLH